MAVACPFRASELRRAWEMGGWKRRRWCAGSHTSSTLVSLPGKEAEEAALSQGEQVSRQRLAQACLQQPLQSVRQHTVGNATSCFTWTTALMASKDKAAAVIKRFHARAKAAEEEVVGAKDRSRRRVHFDGIRGVLRSAWCATPPPPPTHCNIMGSWNCGTKPLSAWHEAW